MEQIDKGKGGPTQSTIIAAENRWGIFNLSELWRYRDLFYFLVRRDVRVLYAQTVLGIGWAILRPLASMIIFTAIFGKLAKMQSDGVPYAIFNFTAVVPWSYFSSSLGGSVASLVSSSGLLSKIYFPRIIIPIAPVISKLVDFAIALCMLACLMIWYEIVPTWKIIFLPYLVLLMMVTASGTGMWLTSLAVQYRDVKHAMNFAIQLWMYMTPIVYSVNIIPEKYRLLYALNPMVGVVEGFRSALLDTKPMPWDLVLIGSCSALVLLVLGATYFHYKERIFADVI